MLCNKFVKTCLLNLFVINLYTRSAHACIFPLTLIKSSGNNLPTNTDKFGYIEYRPNGTIILRSTLENGSNLQNLLLFKTILSAIKVSSFANGGAEDGSKLNIKLYGDGVEHKFPPFLEGLIQRIQSYFSVYKYTDTSRPVRLETIAGAPQTVMETNVNLNLLPSTTVESAAEGGDLETTTFIDIGGNAELTDEFIEGDFISIGENDGFITVGED